MSVPHLTGNRGFKEPLSLDRHTSSSTSVFWLWKTPQVSPNSLTHGPASVLAPPICVYFLLYKGPAGWTLET